MKILFLAHRIPYPPDKGEKIRAFQELRFLAARHTIDLFCFADTQEEAAGEQSLRAYCRRVYVRLLGRGGATLRAVQSLGSGQPFTNAYFFSRSFQAAVRQALTQESYDLILVYSSPMAQYVPQPAPAPLVIDFVDADSTKWAQYSQMAPFPLSWMYAREARLLGRYEKEVAAAAAAAVVSTCQEAAHLDDQGRFRVEVVGNGVSVPAAGSHTALPEEIRALQPYVVFVGTMNYLPNVDAAEFFVREILPHIRRAHPDVRFAVVGRNPSRRVRRLGSRPGVIVTGTVPDPLPYLRGATAAVAPFRICQGVQNKILEALAIGLPVVSTSRPARAIGAKDGETVIVADSPESFARAVISLVEDPKLRNHFRQTWESVRQNFDWGTNLGRLEHLLESLAGAERKTEPGVHHHAVGC